MDTPPSHQPCASRAPKPQRPPLPPPLAPAKAGPSAARAARRRRPIHLPPRPRLLQEDAPEGRGRSAPRRTARGCPGPGPLSTDAASTRSRARGTVHPGWMRSADRSGEERRRRGARGDAVLAAGADPSRLPEAPRTPGPADRRGRIPALTRSRLPRRRGLADPPPLPCRLGAGVKAFVLPLRARVPSPLIPTWAPGDSLRGPAGGPARSRPRPTA